TTRWRRAERPQRRMPAPASPRERRDRQEEPPSRARARPGPPRHRARAGGGGGASPGGPAPPPIGPAAAGKVIGPDGCSASCHKVPVAWWFKDRHQKAADPFLNHAQKNRQIAAFYYGKPADEMIATGRGVCMDCHGTVLTGKSAEEVETGVSCESCHGPAGSYRDTHRDKKSHGERVALGINDLENLDRRAEVCAR